MPDRIANLNTGLARNGPLVLLVAGVVALIYGVVADSWQPIVVAALLLVLAVVLPRLSGPFKFGLQGIVGNLREEVVERVQAEGQRVNLPPERIQKAVEAAQKVVPEGTVITVESQARLEAPEGAITTVYDSATEQIAHYIAEGVLYEDMPRVRECMSCGEFGVPRDDGTCWNCGRPIDR